jgi:hypothetical protein
VPAVEYSPQSVEDVIQRLTGDVALGDAPGDRREPGIGQNPGLERFVEGERAQRLGACGTGSGNVEQAIGLSL